MSEPLTYDRVRTCLRGPRFYYLAFVAFCCTYLLFLLVHARERYDGKTLDEWLAEFDAIPAGVPLETIHDGTFETPDITKSEEVVNHVGTNAIPYLLELLGRKDMKLKRRANQLAQVAHLTKRDELSMPDKMKLRAIMGFKSLGPKAMQAVPELAKLMESSDADVRYAATQVLALVGMNDRAVIPVLLKTISSSPRPECQALAVGALWQIDPKTAATTGFPQPMGLLYLP